MHMHAYARLCNIVCMTLSHTQIHTILAVLTFDFVMSFAVQLELKLLI